MTALIRDTTSRLMARRVATEQLRAQQNFHVFGYNRVCKCGMYDRDYFATRDIQDDPCPVWREAQMSQIPPGIDPVALAKADAEADANGQPPRGGWQIGQQVTATIDESGPAFDVLAKLLEVPRRNGDTVVLVCSGPKKGWHFLVHVSKIRLGWPETYGVALEDSKPIPGTDPVQYEPVMVQTYPIGSAGDAQHLADTLWPRTNRKTIEEIKREGPIIIPRPGDPQRKFVENVGDKGIMAGERAEIVGFSDGGEILQVRRASSASEQPLQPTICGSKLSTIATGSVVAIHCESNDPVITAHTLSAAMEISKERPDLSFLVVPAGSRFEVMELATIKAVRDRLNEVIYDREHGK